MTPGPFDALSSLSHLETSSLQPPSRDNGSDRGFAQHLSPPPTSARRPEREPPRETTREAQRDDRPVHGSASPEAPSQAEQSTRPSEQKQSTAAQSESETRARPAPPAPSPDAAATKAAGDAQQEQIESDQEDPIDLTDEALLTACVAPVITVPIAQDVPATEGDPQAEAVLVDQAKPAQPQPAEGGQADAAPPANSQDTLPEGVVPKTELETSATAPKEQPAVAQAEVSDVPVEVASDAVALVVTSPAPQASEARGPQRSKGQAEKNSTAEATEELVVSETADVEVVDKVTDQQVAPKARDGKKERGRGDAEDTAAPKPFADPTTASATPATTETKAVEAAAIDALPPADASASASSAPPPTSAGNSTTPPTLADNVSAASRLPQHLVARTSTRASSGAPVTNAEQMRMVQRVAKAFQAAQSRENGEIRLRLSPPELGSLKLELKLQGGVMTARVEAETESAKAILLEHLPTLKERLAEQGIQVEKFDVDLMDRRPPDQGQSDSSPQRDRQPGARAPRSLASGRDLPATETGAPTMSGPRNNTNDGRLNVTV